MPLSLTAVKLKPVGSISPFWLPPTTPSIRQSSMRNSIEPSEEIVSVSSSAGCFASSSAARISGSGKVTPVPVSLCTTHSALIAWRVSSRSARATASISTPRRQQVLQRRLPRAVTRRGVDEHLARRAEHALQPGHAGVIDFEKRLFVEIDRRTVDGAQDGVGNVGRSGVGIELAAGLAGHRGPADLAEADVGEAGRVAYAFQHASARQKLRAAVHSPAGRSVLPAREGSSRRIGTAFVQRGTTRWARPISAVTVQDRRLQPA